MSNVREKLTTGLLVCLILGCIAIWYGVVYFESHQNLGITFFDVGQGDSIFIEAAGGNQILVDGGPSAAVLSKLGQAMPFWDRSIDLLVLTHAHADHVTGLVEVLKRYHVGMVLESGEAYSTPEYQEWHTLLTQLQVPVVIARAGQIVNAGNGTLLRVLSPFKNYQNIALKNPHDATVTTRLEYGSTTILLMGDAEKLVEYQLLADLGALLQSTILKIGHHGSKTSSTPAFLQAVRPAVAVISAGRKNRYGHPNQEVLERISQMGIKIFRTDLDGNIKLESDSKRYIIN